MTASEVKKLAWFFKNAQTRAEQREVVRMVYFAAQEEGLRCLSEFTGVKASKLAYIGDIPALRSEINAWRRGRKNARKPRAFEDDTALVAREAAGGLGERRYARRNAAAFRCAEFRGRAGRRMV